MVRHSTNLSSAELAKRVVKVEGFFNSGVFLTFQDIDYGNTKTRLLNA